jgi:hypothetical protein
VILGPGFARGTCSRSRRSWISNRGTRGNIEAPGEGPRKRDELAGVGRCGPDLQAGSCSCLRAVGPARRRALPPFARP